MLERFKQRKVAQWSVAYLAAGWAALQVMQYLATTYNWSPLIPRVAPVILAGGLLLTIVIAWYHGERGRQRPTAVELGLVALIALATIGVASVVGGKTELQDDVARTTAPANRSIAVLPFTNYGPSSEEYFSDGMTEEILNALTQIQDLKVAARTSVFRYKGEKVDIRDVARTLGVAHVLEGSVRKAGNRVRITAQLINAADGYHIWSKDFDRTVTDVFAVQDEIARAITDSLRLRLDDTPTVLVPEATTNARAHDLYLVGLSNLARRGTALPTALENFRDAIALDPSYADAYAQLAKTLVVLPLYTNAGVRASWNEAKRAAQRALVIDPRNGEAYGALAEGEMRWEADFVKAEQDFLKGLATRPGSGPLRHWYAEMLGILGRDSASDHWFKLALETDPSSPVMNIDYGMSLAAAGKNAVAERQLKLGLALDPTFPLAYHWLRNLYIAEGRRAEAGDAFLRAMPVYAEPDARWNIVAAAFTDTTKRAQAIRILNELSQRNPRHNEFALVYLVLGDREGAIGAVAEAVAQGRASTLYFRGAWWDPMRSDPRFVKAMRASNVLAADRGRFEGKR